MGMRRLLAVVVVLVVVVGAVGTVSAQSLVLVDDFEDGDTNIETDGWTGWSGTEMEVESTNQLAGNHSGRIHQDTNEAGEEQLADATRDESNQPANVTFLVQGSNSNFNDEEIIGIKNGSTILVRIVWDHGNDRILITNSTGGDGFGGNQISPVVVASGEGMNEVHDIRIDFDWSAHETTVFFNGTSYGPIPFDESQDTANTVFTRIPASHQSDPNHDIIWDDVHWSGAAGTLAIEAPAFMEHGSERSYTVTLDGNDVTADANVTSSDTSVVTVDEANATLVATSDQSVNQEVTITAKHVGFTSTHNVTVANKTLDNIAALPPPTWLSATFGHPGDTTGSSDTWPGAVQLQWLFVCLVVGAIVSWKSGHAILGVGVAEVMLAFGWAIAWVSDGVLIASIIFVVYAALAIGDVASGGMAEG